MDDNPPTPAAPEPLRVLILEDDARDAQLEARALARAGLTCAHRRVETREAFEAALQEFRPHVVLADYTVPGFGGEAALELVLADFPDVPVIVVSGTLGDERAVELVKAGAADYVLKDNVVRLAPAVRRAVERANERRQRGQAERALHESEERFRNLIEGASDIVAVARFDGTIAYISPAVRDVAGYEPRELIGRSYFELLVPEDVPKARENLAALAATPDKSLRSERRYRHKNGSVITCEAHVKSRIGVPGIEGIVVNLRDISARIAADHQLRTQLAELQQWQNLNLDREDRVIELKREINQLLERLNEPRRYPATA